MAGYVIHTPAGLTPTATAEASALGPSAVGADVLPDALAQRAGLTVLEYVDVTDEFYRTCCAFHDGLTALESSIRAVDGDEAFEDDCARKASMREGIERHLLRRCLIVVLKD